MNRSKLSTYLWLISFGFVASLFLLELIFRFLPVVQVTHHFSTLEGVPLLRLEPNSSVTWSRGPLLVDPVESEVNSLGFVDSIDPSLHSGRKSIALIGDSYIEALMVPEPDRITSKLRSSDWGKRYQFVPLAVSGAPLSQYLLFTQFAEKAFQPAIYVFFIIENDLLESACRWQRKAQFSCFDDRSSPPELVPPRNPLSFVRKLSSYSALARYLRANAGIGALINPPKAVSSTIPEESEYLWIIDAFFNALADSVKRDDQRFIFVVDTARSRIYGDEDRGDEAFFSHWRKHFLEIAESRGYETLDLDSVFQKRFKSDGQRFEFPDDRHWNAHGHDTVATALIGRLDQPRFDASTSE